MKNKRYSFLSDVNLSVRVTKPLTYFCCRVVPLRCSEEGAVKQTNERLFFTRSGQTFPKDGDAVLQNLERPRRVCADKHQQLRRLALSLIAA